MTDGTVAASPRGALHLLVRTLAYVRPVRARMAGKAVLTAISLTPALLLPWPAKLVIDRIVLDQPPSTQGYPGFLVPVVRALDALAPLELLLVVFGGLLLMIAVFGTFGADGSERDITEGGLAQGTDTATQTENQANLGFSFAGGLFGLFDYRFTLRLTQDLNHFYRARLFERIASLPMRAFDDARVGDAVYRVMYDTPAISGLVYEVLLTPFVTTTQIALTAWILYAAYPAHAWLGTTALLVLPVALLTSLPFARLVRARSETSRERGSATTAVLEEGVSQMRAVQALGAETRELSRFDRASAASFDAFRAYVRGIILTVLVVGSFVVASAIVVFRQVTDLAIAGSISVGDFAVVLGYALQIGGYAGRMGQIWIRVQGNLAGLARVFWLLDLEPERNAPDARPLAPVRHGVRLENVWYRYPDGTEALSGIDLEAPRGQLTALVGPAGAGKTTLLSLIPRFVDPDAGRVEIDGVSVRELERKSLREQIAVVFQETALFDATVEENIRVGRQGATREDVERAARAAGADGFIRGLPFGYQTPLGRAGDKLSVGQKQRVAIARALVRDPAVLIFDEPTSALDPESERALVGSLHEAARERVVIVIAHRLASIRGADQIVFVDGGRVIERGTHEELMRLPRGAYRSFVDL